MTLHDRQQGGSTLTGTLLDHLVGFREELARCGYGPVRSGAHLELFAELCGWLGREDVALGELGSTQVAMFLADRRRRGSTDLVSRVGVRPLLDYLTRTGAIPEQRFAIPEGPSRLLLEHYRQYLEVERGVTPRGVERYVGVAGRFVDTHLFCSI